MSSKDPPVSTPNCVGAEEMHSHAELFTGIRTWVLMLVPQAVCPPANFSGPNSGFFSTTAPAHRASGSQLAQLHRVALGYHLTLKPATGQYTPLAMENTPGERTKASECKFILSWVTNKSKCLPQEYKSCQSHTQSATMSLITLKITKPACKVLLSICNSITVFPPEV